jgi:uncharacterized membrane protein (DUF2068 family)
LSVDAQAPVASGGEQVLKRAPTLYLIIVFKLVKGTLLVLLGLGVYTLSDNNLPEAFKSMLQFLHLDPERKFFAETAIRLGSVTQGNMLWLAWGTMIYSIFSLVEGIGLIFRVSWAGWLAMGESVFFIPIEVYELIHRMTLSVFIILFLNIVIAWYLFQNRRRLFHHHHHLLHRRGDNTPPQPGSSPPSP